MRKTLEADPSYQHPPRSDLASASKRTDRIGVEPKLLERARSAYSMVTRRRQMLGDALFFDPAWNMLLDLFINEACGRRLSVTALCIGSHSSSATALRYVAMLVRDGLIERVADATDGRRSHVHLSPKGWQAMRSLLSS